MKIHRIQLLVEAPVGTLSKVDVYQTTAGLWVLEVTLSVTSRNQWSRQMTDTYKDVYSDHNESLDVLMRNSVRKSPALTPENIEKILEFLL